MASMDTSCRVVNSKGPHLGHAEVVLDALHKILDLQSISVLRARLGRMMVSVGEDWPHVCALRSDLCCRLLR